MIQKLKLAIKNIINQWPLVKPKGIIKVTEVCNGLSWNMRNKLFHSEIVWEEKVYISELTGKIYGDANITETYQKLNRFRFTKTPAFWLYKLTGVTVFTDEGLVFTNDNYLIEESTHNFGNSIKKSRFFKLFYFFSKDIRKLEGNVAIISSNGTSNYYHWMTDGLPRLAAYEKYFSIIDFYLIPEKAYNFHYETLLRAGVKQTQIIKIGKRSKIRVETLFFATIPSGIGVASIEASKYVKNLFNDEKVSLESFSKIYISRKNANWRKIINEEEIIQILIKAGFTIFDFDKNPLSVEQQAKIFRSASIIIAPHGAALTNIMFTEAATHVCELINPYYFGADCYFTLSNQYNLNYSVIIGEQCESNLNYRINPIHLINYISNTI